MRKRRFWITVWTFLGLLLGGCFPKEALEPRPLVCPGGTSAPALSVPFETIDQGVHSGIRSGRQLVVRDSAAWAALWAEHIAGRVSAPPLPVIDFAREMVIAFFLGEKPTSGYSAGIAEIVFDDNKLIVRVDVESPPPGTILLQMLTQPFHIVMSTRSDAPVEFVIVERETKRSP